MIIHYIDISSTYIYTLHKDKHKTFKSLKQPIVQFNKNNQYIQKVTFSAYFEVYTLYFLRKVIPNE